MTIIKLRKIDKFAPSQNPYWFNLASIQHKKLGAKIEAIWFGRKAGRTTVTLGTYHLFFPELERSADVDHIIENADTRYGGSWLYQWDGERFLHEPTAPLNLPADLAMMQLSLNTLLENSAKPFPHGSSWSGPYYKTKV